MANDNPKVKTGMPPGLDKNIVKKSLVDEFIKYLMDRLGSQKKPQAVAPTEPSDLGYMGVQDPSMAMNLANTLMKRKKEQEALLRSIP